MLPDGGINPGQMTSFNHYALGAVEVPKTDSGIESAVQAIHPLSLHTSRSSPNYNHLLLRSPASKDVSRVTSIFTQAQSQSLTMLRCQLGQQGAHMRRVCSLRQIEATSGSI
jgi:hypothetical protein